MKTSRLFLVAALMLGTVFTAKAQTLKNFLDNKDSSFTWLGIDFTQARLIGDAGAKPIDFVDSHFAGINQVVVNEPKKYDVPGNMRHDKVTYDISLVNKRNAAVNPDNFKSDNSADLHRLSEEDVTKLVKSFDFGTKKGIGALLVMDGMSKTDKKASAFVTLVDMGSRRVLMTERIEGKTGMAFGNRNYWALPIKYILDNFHDDYNKLKEKYANATDPVEPAPAPAPAPAPKKTGKTGVAAKKAPAAKKKS
ncbi:hypothetical protein [Chitinophaga sp. sic0106]|uniref:hypothetical protein n=1 Tax=Chitinophaga sp. sic0106 TaxID=2854785 RepID=UPI001C494CB4|nr:hypothetical protein [Chitinophaga sp. sic0106]MBV7531874.1 hypothetical protein [Chitinophaga sp. sic0106]